MICKKLLNLAVPRMKNLKVEDLRIGLGYVALKNSAGGVGLSYVLRDRLPQGCSQLKGSGEYIGADLEDVAKMFMDHGNVLRSSLGLAAINSVSPTGENGTTSGDVMEILDIKKDEWVGMVGYFAPLVKRINKITPHLFVIEDKLEYRKNGTYRIFDEIMNNCDVMIITATSLINKTFEEVLSKTEKARKRVLLGPSSPLYRDFFEGMGLDIISGMIVQDTEKVMNIVSQGGGTRDFKNYSKKVNIVMNG
ncbi:MAG: DUF364 domain-containing protein [Candidatus Eremiobacteraeota bacterium]|nr:DUF364 domain-containing protein [Candidatus Eremiobacteraeota bacterium]